MAADYKIYQGDALSVLRSMESETIQCAITSPPYYSLRSYQTDPVIWGNEFCEHVWGETLPYAKQDNRTAEQKREQGATVGNSVNSIGFAVGNSGVFCLRCNAWRGELGLEPSFDCQRDRHNEIEIRENLTNEEREDLIRELLILGVIR